MAESMPLDGGGIHARRLSAIDEAMQSYVDQGKLAGISTLIAHHGQIIHRGCYGMLDVAAQKPLQEDSLFRIYSLTKPILAAGVLILLDDGLVALDQPISTWIPEFRHARVWRGIGAAMDDTVPLTTEITVWHLLTHTAGLAYGFGEPAHPIDQLYQRTELTQPPLTLQYSLPELARKLAALPLVDQPGAEWHYSLAHDVLGYLIEQLSGLSCGVFLQERLFGPLGMHDTSFFVPPEKHIRFGPLYSYSDQGGLVVADDVANSPFIDPAVVPSGGGGLVSSMYDYHRFLSLLAQGGMLDGVRVLKESTVTAMLTNQLHGSLFPVRFDEEWPDMGYGLGIGVQTQGLHQYGWIGISGTTAWVHPDEAMILIALPQALYNWEASDRFLELARTLLTSGA